MAQVRTREDVRQMCFQMSNTTQKEKWFLIKWFRRFDDETKTYIRERMKGHNQSIWEEVFIMSFYYFSLNTKEEQTKSIMEQMNSKSCIEQIKKLSISNVMKKVKLEKIS